MKSIPPVFLFLLLAVLHSPCPVFAAEESFRFGRFGAITLYHPPAQPAAIVLFVSGDGGWNQGVVDMARELAGLGAVVVGIDIRHYLRNLEAAGDACSYPAADLEALSKFVQKKLGLPKYHLPMLVGYSSGATLVYAVLVQAPPGTFAGAISMGFCPGLPLTKPLCRGSGLDWRPGPHGKGYAFLPAQSLRTPWIVLHGVIDQVCSLEAVRPFVSAVPGAGIVALPKVGHGFSIPRNWLPQFKTAFTRLAEQQRVISAQVPETKLDLPIVEVPAEGPESDLLAVVLSGDGGWTGIDREIGEALAKRGIPVAGLNSLQYFWTARTPESTAADLARMLRHYLGLWNKQRVILIGYSFGADVLPFAVNRLPQDLRQAVMLIALLGPAQNADFEFHVTEWLVKGTRRPTHPILPEVKKLRGSKVLCLYGEEEKDSLCRQLTPEIADLVPLKGGHHFGGKYNMIAEKILEALPHGPGRK